MRGLAPRRYWVLLPLGSSGSAAGGRAATLGYWGSLPLRLRCPDPPSRLGFPPPRGRGPHSPCSTVNGCERLTPSGRPIGRHYSGVGRLVRMRKPMRHSFVAIGCASLISLVIGLVYAAASEPSAKRVEVGQQPKAEIASAPVATLSTEADVVGSITVALDLSADGASANGRYVIGREFSTDPIRLFDLQNNESLVIPGATLASRHARASNSGTVLFDVPTAVNVRQLRSWRPGQTAPNLLDTHGGDFRFVAMAPAAEIALVMTSVHVTVDSVSTTTNTLRRYDLATGVETVIRSDTVNLNTPAGHIWVDGILDVDDSAVMALVVACVSSDDQPPRTPTGDCGGRSSVMMPATMSLATGALTLLDPVGEIAAGGVAVGGIMSGDGSTVVLTQSRIGLGDPDLKTFVYRNGQGFRRLTGVDGEFCDVLVYSGGGFRPHMYTLGRLSYDGRYVACNGSYDYLTGGFGLVDTQTDDVRLIYVGGGPGSPIWVNNSGTEMLFGKIESLPGLFCPYCLYRWSLPTVPPDPPPAATVKYVALGDSYSAGEGIEPFFEGPEQECHRSELAYATLVRSPDFSDTFYRLRTDPTAHVEWGFQACSGALTEHVLTSGFHGDPYPQLEKVRPGDANPNDLPVDDATDLVTITIGGNDAGFADSLSFCWKIYDCQDVPMGTNGVYRDQLAAQVAGVGPQVRAVYEKLRAQAPNALIIVLGYPHLFPESKQEMNCAKLRQHDVKYVTTQPGTKKPQVSRISQGYSINEQRMFRDFTVTLNSILADEVQRIGSSRMLFVPVADHFKGHEVCGNAPGGEWINGPSASISLDLRNDQSFHPNDTGQQAYARCVNAVFLGTAVPCVSGF